MIFGSLKYRKKESDRILSEIAKIKLQKNFYNYFIRTVCFHLNLSLHFKVNENKRREKFTLQNIKSYKLNII